MKIRRYIGRDTQEAILKVKMDLGSDAVIFNTRKVKQKGLRKFFSKPLIEVLAALDEDYNRKKDYNKNSENAIGKTKGVNSEDVHRKAGDIEKLRSINEKDVKIFELEEKLNNIEKMLWQLSRKTKSPEEKQTDTVANRNISPQSEIAKQFYKNLVKNDVDPQIAQHIINTATSKMTQSSDINEMASVIYSTIANMLGKPDTIRFRKDGKPTVVIFVGPTGVGKTTTLAKLAANYALNERKKVGFITADTYRIAAIDQLKTYAEILGIPVSVVYSSGEIKDAISSYSNKDLILIDTAGRCHNNKTQFDELKELVHASQADEVFLLINSVTSLRNCREIIKHYSFLNDYKLIFTKLDETSVTGIILNTRIITGKNISYITTGQNVPDDIETANIEKIAKNLLGSSN